MMGTFNGEKYISEQLDSILNQTHKNWRLIVSDDGSSDDTLAILKTYEAKLPAGQLIILKGPHHGFAANFLSMCLDDGAQADYYAFCDQDDIWLENKLEVALKWLDAQSNKVPTLYCGGTIYVSGNSKEVGRSVPFSLKPSFSNALVQCLAGGNTMIFNQPLKSLVVEAGNVKVSSHDWWVYILCTATGGLVKFDPNPYVLYRQHSESLVGSNTAILAKLKRIWMGINGSFKVWNDQNIASLKRVSSKIPMENLSLLKEFEVARQSNILRRIDLITRRKVYRSSLFGELMLLFAAILRKF